MSTMLVLIRYRPSHADFLRLIMAIHCPPLERIRGLLLIEILALGSCGHCNRPPAEMRHVRLSLESSTSCSQIASEVSI